MTSEQADVTVKGMEQIVKGVLPIDTWV